MGLRMRLASFYPASTACLLFGAASLFVAELSDDWDANHLGYRFARGLAWIAIGTGALALVVDGLRRVRSGIGEVRGPSDLGLVGWLVLLVGLVLAVAGLANVGEAIGPEGWANYVSE